MEYKSVETFLESIDTTLTMILGVLQEREEREKQQETSTVGSPVNDLETLLPTPTAVCMEPLDFNFIVEGPPYTEQSVHRLFESLEHVKKLADVLYDAIDDSIPVLKKYGEFDTLMTEVARQLRDARTAYNTGKTDDYHARYIDPWVDLYEKRQSKKATEQRENNND